MRVRITSNTEIDLRADLEPDQKAAQPALADSQEEAPNSASGVRFAEEDEEIDPVKSIPTHQQQNREDLTPEAHEQIRNLAMSLQKCR